MKIAPNSQIIKRQRIKREKRAKKLRLRAEAAQATHDTGTSELISIPCCDIRPPADKEAALVATFGEDAVLEVEHLLLFDCRRIAESVTSHADLYRQYVLRSECCQGHRLTSEQLVEYLRVRGLASVEIPGHGLAWPMVLLISPCVPLYERTGIGTDDEGRRV